MGIIISELGVFGNFEDYENSIVQLFDDNSGASEELRARYKDQAVNIIANRHKQEGNDLSTRFKELTRDLEAAKSRLCPAISAPVDDSSFKGGPLWDVV